MTKIPYRESRMMCSDAHGRAEKGEVHWAKAQREGGVCNPRVEKRGN